MENLRAVMTPEGLVSFECKVIGYPTPQLKWLKDGRELKPGDVYQLTGTNSLGEISFMKWSHPIISWNDMVGKVIITVGKK